MRVGVMILPESPWATAERQWRTVDDLGFDSGWTLDHLWWRSLSEGPWFSTFPFLTAAATATSRIRIGTMVTSPNFRHPLIVAKDAVTLDDVSGGRFTLGMGAGATRAGDTYAVDSAPLSPVERADRFQEFVTLVDTLLREPAADHTGRYYAVNGARMYPGCVQEPRLPIAIAAAGPRGQDLAARYGDAWVSCGPLDVARPWSQDEFREAVRAQLRGLARACERVGREFGDLGRIVVTTDVTGELLRSAEAFLDQARRYADLGVTEIIIQWPRAEGVYAGDPAVLEDIAAKALPRLRDL
ncbi:MAG TPA: LLM class flavin-dependent oxidoreductase [Kribbellaceae bacterium]|nr:LLM class flavin-dependent oxidoreductase [Kribbellaceae bacterium]